MWQVGLPKFRSIAAVPDEAGGNERIPGPAAEQSVDSSGGEYVFAEQRVERAASVHALVPRRELLRGGQEAAAEDRAASGRVELDRQPADPHRRRHQRVHQIREQLPRHHAASAALRRLRGLQAPQSRRLLRLRGHHALLHARSPQHALRRHQRRRHLPLHHPLHQALPDGSLPRAGDRRRGDGGRHRGVHAAFLDDAGSRRRARRAAAHSECGRIDAAGELGSASDRGCGEHAVVHRAVRCDSAARGVAGADHEDGDGAGIHHDAAEHHAGSLQDVLSLVVLHDFAGRRERKKGVRA